MAVAGGLDQGVRDPASRTVRPLRFGVIPTNGRECVIQAIGALRPQVDHIMVIQAGRSIIFRDYPLGVVVVTDNEKPNISRWWNTGIDWAKNVATALGHERWDVAIINDDVIVPSGWMCFVADDLREYGAVAGCSGGLDYGSLIVHRVAGPVPLHERMQGFAFVICGESGLRADEELTWYFGDDDLGWRAAEAGGMALKPGCHVTHLYPNGQVTPDLHVQNAESAEAFKAKWGYMPW